jgi:hypothetical protein
MPYNRAMFDKRRSEGIARALFVTLLLVLSIFAQLIVKAERAAATTEARLCEVADLGKQAQNKGVPSHGHPGMASDHCGACAASMSSPLPESDVSIFLAPPIVRSAALGSKWIIPPERQRAGETRSRAPPSIS